MNNAMVIHYPFMTGDELKNIYKLSELKQEEFAEKLHLASRSALINQFNKKNKRIDEDVEKAVKELPELAQHRMMLVSKQNNVQENASEGSEIVKFLTETIQVLKDVVVKGEKQTALMQKAVDTIADSNLHIRQDAELYRRMIADSYDAGLLQWTKPNKK